MRFLCSTALLMMVPSVFANDVMWEEGWSRLLVPWSSSPEGSTDNNVETYSQTANPQQLPQEFSSFVNCQPCPESANSPSSKNSVDNTEGLDRQV
jgi:hypothetical protein